MGLDLRIDVERIRLPSEDHACATMERERRWGRVEVEPYDARARRRELLAKALLLTDAMAPDAYAAARDARAALGIQDEIELFQSGGSVDTARLALHGDPIGIEFMGAYLGSLDRGALLAVIGHEIGHALAHCRHPRFAWAFDTSQRAATPTLRRYAMAAEITADRFGLLVSRDIDAVLRLEMRTAAGRGAPGIRLDTATYLRQARRLAEDILQSGSRVAGYTHPEHYVRAYAEWLFSETDVYAEMTGVGPGSRSLDEVNQLLDRLIGGRGAESATKSALANEKADEEADGDEDDEEGAEPDIIASARQALSKVTDALTPSVRRFVEAARNTLAADHDPPPEDIVDPLEEDRRELLARFEELERREKNE